MDKILSNLHPWILASRPRTLPAAMAPVIVGSAIAIANGSFSGTTTLVILACAILLQIGANFTNDVFDFEKGTDTDDRQGPLRMTQAGLLTPVAMRWGSAVVFTLAAAGGLYLIWLAGWPILVLGIGSILSAIAYTAGRHSLSNLGLGDLFVLLFFGFVAVCGTVFIHTGTVRAATLWAALAVGAMVTAILVVNNVRDIETDRLAGRATIPVKWGRTAGVIEFMVLLTLGILVPVIAVIDGIMPWPVLLVVLILPSAIRLIDDLIQLRGKSLNRTLAHTAKLAVIHALLFSLGIILESVWVS